MLHVFWRAGMHLAGPARGRLHQTCKALSSKQFVVSVARARLDMLCLGRTRETLCGVLRMLEGFAHPQWRKGRLEWVLLGRTTRAALTEIKSHKLSVHYEMLTRQQGSGSVSVESSGVSMCTMGASERHKVCVLGVSGCKGVSVMLSCGNTSNDWAPMLLMHDSQEFNTVLAIHMLTAASEGGFSEGGLADKSFLERVFCGRCCRPYRRPPFYVFEHVCACEAASGAV
mmetsp:Transcript_66298/g.138194  ORF Transcript_66298/g.138194 Transcript_66298/m.138194 type:complete len:228 (+) Transcript_66298:457-1140(+)